jgi:REP element-mobilizing transposase RayT
MRKVPFVNEEIYHVYNRGVDRRKIFLSDDDFTRFILGLNEFNNEEPIGSIYENSFQQKGNLIRTEDKLVNIICYCLNPNHFHLILEQISDDGISRFMQRLGTGYTMYFNNKLYRNGALFQGRFKSAHLNNNDDLLRLSVYVNLNNHIHQLGGSTSKWRFCSSWNLFSGKNRKEETAAKLVVVDRVLEQFENPKEYKKFAEDLLPILIEQKREQNELAALLLE